MHVNPFKRDKQSGFTLIELMITVAIIAILASVAFPSYQQYVIRSNRSEMQQFMMDIANREEEFLLNNRIYATSLSDLGLALPGRLQSLYSAPTITKKDSPPSYDISAAPKIGSIQSSDPTLGLTSLGAKTPADKW